MNRYSFMSQFLVDESEQEILFYTQTPPVGVAATTLWKYEPGSRELKVCFEINKRINIRKYNVDKGESGLRYIATSYPGTTSVIGLDVHGSILFEYYVDSFAGEPIYDRLGDIYISVGNVWIYCLSNEGKLLWKWRPVSNENRRITEGIRNYWIANEKLYVLAIGQEYVVALDGTMEESHTIAEYNEATRYAVQKDRFFFTTENYRELLCYNYKAEKLWQYSVDENEKIFEIITGQDNMVCLRVKNRIDETTKLYVIDKNGKKKWDTMREWSRMFTVYDEQIVLIRRKGIVIYDDCGKKLLEYGGKKNIIWGRVIAEKLIMIVEGRGDIAVVECSSDLLGEAYIAKPMIKEQTEEVMSSEKMMFWRNQLLEYLILNMEIWVKYFSVEIREITLSCEIFKEIQIQVLTPENQWIDGRACNIPYEKREEEDRDLFKECSCRDDIVWIEFCDDCPKEQIATVMEMVCKSMNEKLGVLVNLQIL